MIEGAADITRRPVAALGFRRVGFVRLIVDGQRTTAEVTGIAHRLPRTIRVPLRSAGALIAAGVPSLVEARPRTSDLRGG